MHTKDFLAQELRKAGLEEMAVLAGTGYYHDYLSPLAMPEFQLMNDLHEAQLAAKNPEPIMALKRRHLNGEFDASKEESDEWAASPDGQATMSLLTKGMK